MPLSDEVRNLLLKYIAGETDDEESEKVERWLRDDPKIFEEFEQLWDLWYAVGAATNVFRFNVDKGWEEVLRKRMQIEEAKKSSRSLKKIMIWSGSAAAVLLLLLATLFWWKNENKNLQTQQTGQIALLSGAPAIKKDTTTTSQNTLIAKTASGERKQISLPDGSQVWLNGNTKITFITSKKNSKRILYLSGQGFFDIKHNVNKPFIVKTPHASIKVLGTRFDVIAYPDDAVTEAVLTGGSILFTTNKVHKQISRHIDPGQKVSINYLSGQLKVINVDTTFYTLWREGKLLFRNETFARVAKAMEHKYGIQIIFKDQSLSEERLNGYLEKESLREALEALKLTLQFQYKIENEEVIIYK